MTGAHRPRKADSNGIPVPVVRWMTVKPDAVGKCETCLWYDKHADISLARLHVKTYPDHHVVLTKAEITAVYSETTDGVLWTEAVNAL